MSLPALGVELRTEPAAQAQVHKFHRPRNSGLARSLEKWAAAKRKVGSGVTWGEIYKHFGECLTVVVDGGGLLSLLILLLRGFSGTGPLVRVLLGIRTPLSPPDKKTIYFHKSHFRKLTKRHLHPTTRIPTPHSPLPRKRHHPHPKQKRDQSIWHWTPSPTAQP